jgi:Uma2 family endonuclease
MIVQLHQLDVNKTYTYADYLTWKFAEMVELIKGKIVKMSPAPLSYHQRITMNLSVEIGYVLRRKRCKIYAAPFDVRLLEGKKNAQDQEILTVVQPDICIICDATKIDRRGCLGAPDMVVEVLSAATSTKDLTTKYDLYQENGVKEYWVVYPHDEIIQVFDLNDSTKKYKTRGVYTPETAEFVQVKTINHNILLIDIFDN